MISYKLHKPLVSIHIPKTGGAGFRELLKLWFKEKLLLHYFDEKNKIMPPKYELFPSCCIHGHFNRRRGFGIEDYYPDVDQFITFLRDPFEILVSRYYYVKKNEKKSYSFRDGQKLFLVDDVNDYLYNEVRNINYHPNILDYFPRVMSESNYKSIIDNFIYIGFTDSYQQSVRRLSELLNFPYYDLGIINTSERYGEVDPELRSYFIKTHPLEYEVYYYAKEIFTSRT